MGNLEEAKTNFLLMAFNDGFNMIKPRFQEDPFYMEEYEKGQRRANREWTEQELNEYYEWMGEQANG